MKFLTAIMLLLATSAQAAILNYSATLTPEGASGRTGSGFVTVSFDNSNNELTFFATFSGLSGLTTQSHFHCCTSLPFAGNSGIAVDSPSLPIPIGVSAGSFGATLDLDDPSNFNPAYLTASGGTTGSAITRLLQGFDDHTAYLNIHSSTFTGGEIRGFTSQVPEPTSAALVILALAALGTQKNPRKSTKTLPIQ